MRLNQSSNSRVCSARKCGRKHLEKTWGLKLCIAIRKQRVLPNNTNTTKSSPNGVLPLARFYSWRFRVFRKQYHQLGIRFRTTWVCGGHFSLKSSSFTSWSPEAHIIMQNALSSISESPLSLNTVQKSKVSSETQGDLSTITSCKTKNKLHLFTEQ